jgi:VanZ family protein
MFNRKKWNYLLFFSLTAVCFLTISPFNFVVPEQLSWQIVIDKFHSLTTIKDYVRNILLFIPLGIAWAGIFSNKKYNSWQILAVSLLLSAILSGSIELLQTLLPSRTSSLSDVVCNSLGGLLGSSLYCGNQDSINLVKGIIQHDYQHISLKFLATIILSYCTTIICAFILLFNSINFNNWNNNASLAIASEVTGQIFWRGYVTSLYICDRAIDSSEIVAAFEHTDSFFSQLPTLVTSLIFLDYQSSYVDRNQQIPDLSWHQELTPRKINSSNSLAKIASYNSSIDYQIHHNKTVLFNKKNSLISAAAATNLNQKLKASQEFSLSIILASDKLKQAGPSRIVSLGEDIYNRNLMLGQEDSNLVFRLRTPSAGTNASLPGFYLPNFFKDQDLHQILITFAQNKLTFYVDHLEHQYTFKFQPATLAKLFLPWTTQQWNINLQNYNLLQSQIVFYSLILFLPILLSGIFILSLIAKLDPK